MGVRKGDLRADDLDHSPPWQLAPDLHSACERWRDRPAITFQGHTFTYGELGRRVAALAEGYRRLGVTPGDRVVCQLPNCPDHMMAINAAWACGAIHAGTDHDIAAPELAWLTEWTAAAALLFQPRADRPQPLAALDEVRHLHPATRLIVHDPAGVDGLVGADTVSLAELTDPAGALSAPPPVPQLADDATALLLLTSGTTGKPKAIRESRPHCWAKMQFFADAFRPGPGDVHLVYLPVGHVFGLRLALVALLTGGRLVLMDRFSPDEALRLVTEERVTILPGMPTHFRLLLDRLDPARHDVSSLRWAISAAATLPRPLAEQIYARLPAELLFVYGCSEGFTTQTFDRDEILNGSVGRQVFRGPPGTAPAGEVAVVEPETREPLPPGEVGEIVFSAKEPVRYWGGTEVATDGWYRTGDLGRLDREGRVYIVGRLKELVNRGGLKVAPTEIETAIARHPAVSDAAVVGSSDPVLGEAICACVVPAGNKVPSLGELRSFLSGTLARHKLPDELCVLDAIPRTKIGKVDRGALAALVDRGDLPPERLRPR